MFNLLADTAPITNDQVLQKLIFATVYGAVKFGVFLLLKWASNKWATKTPSILPIGYLLLIFVYVVACCSAIFFFRNSESFIRDFAVFVSLASLSLGLIFLHELRKFWRTGIYGADAKVVGGMSYAQSLQLCRNRLDFMGVGGAKLTALPEFEAAINRCQKSDQAVRFLLMNPDEPTLQDSARRQGQDAQEHQKRVRRSLESLARMVEERKLNIKVKFYNRKPKFHLHVFRLMFINEDLCLVSFNEFGKHEGRESPQLHVVRSPESIDSGNFYRAFEMYFQELWENHAVDWDVKKYLRND